MGGVTYLMLWGLEGVLVADTVISRLIIVGGAGSVGLATYLGMIALLRVEEAKQIAIMIWQRVRRSG
jgi:hypothetical protein